MYLKRYSVASLLLMVVVGWFVYAFVSQASTTVDFFGIPMPSLPVALWVIVAMFILYLASLAHMSFYSLLGSFKLRKYEKDYSKLLDAIVDAIVGKTGKDYNFQTTRYKVLGSLLCNSKIFPNGKMESEDKKLNEIFKAVEKVKSGEVVDIKYLGLDKDSDLVIQNERNKYKMGALKAEEILSKPQKYNKEFCFEVYGDFVKNANSKQIMKFREFITKSSLTEIVKRVNASKNPLSISVDELVSLCDMVDMTDKELIELSVSAKEMIPDNRIKLFEVLSDKKEEAMDAYLFTLFDLEMLSLADVILDNSQPDEYPNFKAYRALKECGKNFNIELFI